MKLRAPTSRRFPAASLRPALAVLWCAIVSLPAAAARAANGTPAATAQASSNEKLIARLPDPSQFEKSPLESAVEDPTEQTPEYRRIVADLHRHNLPAALQESRALAARYPDSHPKVHVLHGLLAMLSKQYDEADKAFHNVVILLPKKGLGWMAVCAVQLLQGHSQEALANARKAAAVEPSNVSCWIAVAHCEYRLHHLAEAATAARRGTQADPRSVPSWYGAGRCDLLLHRYDQAAVEFRNAANLAPNALPIQGALAVCSIESGRPADAIPPLSRIVGRAPNDVVADVKLAYCYLMTGRAARGVEVCRNAVRVQPRYAAAWDMLGQCYRRAGKTREAVDAFQHGVSLAPGDLNLRTHLDEARQTTAPGRA